jgi:hypothetical protein
MSGFDGTEKDCEWCAAIVVLREFVRFAELPETVTRGEYIRYQVKAISAAKDLLAHMDQDG